MSTNSFEIEGEPFYGEKLTFSGDSIDRSGAEDGEAVIEVVAHSDGEQDIRISLTLEDLDLLIEKAESLSEFMKSS